MARSPPLLYEVYLHAEHEEEERGVSPEEARAEESASASTDGFVVESANTSRTAVRLARRAARGAGGLAVRAARASLKLAGSPAPVGADEDRRRPVLAASARGAELAVAVGGVVRAFRDEDDFQRLLASWSAAAPSASPVPGAAGKEHFENDRVMALSWAADGSAFAAATEGGDVHVVSRLGEPLRVQTKNHRRSRAPPVACFLALVRSDGDDRDGGSAQTSQSGQSGYDLLVITRACDGGARACAHVQRVDAPDATRRGATENLKKPTSVASRRLEGAPFAFVTGAAWHEPSRTLAVVGVNEDFTNGSTFDAKAFSRASSPGAGLWRFARGELARAAAPIPPRRASVSAETRGTGTLKTLKREKKGKGPLNAAFKAFVAAAYTRAVAARWHASEPAWCVAVRGSVRGGPRDETDRASRGAPFEMAAVDRAGVARVWRENSETASLEQVFESSGAHGAPAVSAAWWSPGKLAVSFEDGAVIVADVDAFLKRRLENAPPENDFPETNGNVLGSAPERFEASRERAGVLLAACPMPAASANGTSDPVYPGAETARVAVLEFPDVAEVAEVTGDEPRPVRPTGSSQIRWRVATIGSRTPRQALERALEREDWEGAEALCAAHPATLDLDDARKRRFLRTPPRRARGALDGFWGDIRDRAWAVVAAATVVCDSYETQRVALEKALRETERWISADSADASASRATESTESRNETGPGPSPRDPNERNRVENRGKLENWSWWHRLRLVVLARLDRLDASHASRLGAFKGEAWRRMSAQSAEDAAKSLASRDDARGAVAVARAFPRAVVADGALLRILETFSETTSVAAYEPLLPWRAPWNARAFPARVSNEAVASSTLNRAGFKIGAHRFGSARVADFVESPDAVEALLRERDGDEAYASSALARAARVSADALALAESQGATPSATWLLRSTEHVLAAAEAAEEARGGDGAKEFSWRPATSGEPGGDAGWALRRALRCDAAAGASDTAAELLADAASRVPVDGTESAELRRVAALASTFAAAARDAPPPIRARRIGKRFPSPRLPPGSGPGNSRASSTPSTARLLPPRIRVRRDRKRKRKRKRNRRSRSPSSSPCGPPRWRRFWTRRRGDASRSRSRTARATSSSPNPRSPPPRRVRSFGNRREPAATRFARGW